MPGLDAVSDVTPGEIARDGDDRLDFVETVHNRREGGHQLLSLDAHVAAEQRSGFGRRLEKTGVEQCRRLIGDRGDFDKAGLDLAHLLRGHGWFPRIRREPRQDWAHGA